MWLGPRTRKVGFCPELLRVGLPPELARGGDPYHEPPVCAGPAPSLPPVSRPLWASVAPPVRWAQGWEQLCGAHRCHRPVAGARRRRRAPAGTPSSLPPALCLALTLSLASENGLAALSPAQATHKGTRKGTLAPWPWKGPRAVLKGGPAPPSCADSQPPALEPQASGSPLHGPGCHGQSRDPG